MNINNTVRTEAFQVIEIRTGRIIGTYGTKIRAIRKADRLDVEYGAINFHAINFRVVRVTVANNAAVTAAVNNEWFA